MTLFRKPNLELDFRSYIVHQHKRQYVHRQFHLLSLRLYAPWCTKVNRRRVEMITGWIRSARINGGAIRPDNGQGALYNASQNGSLYAPLLESLVYSSSYSSSSFFLSQTIDCAEGKDSARNRYELNGPISISRYVGQSIGGSLLKRCEHHRQKLSARREDIKGRAEQEQIKLELMAQPELRWDLFREYAMYVKTTVTCMNGIILLV
jgi:hypothetical protein